MSYDIIKEDVPRFVKRLGDRVLEGSNNVTLILGGDRAAPGEAGLNSGYGHADSNGNGHGAGAAHLITGRASENPNFKDDLSYIYLSMKTDVDKVIESKHEFEDNELPAAILKSDAIRLVGRKSFKIIVGKCYIAIDGDKIVIDGPDIKLGSEATERLIKGDLFTKIYLRHYHTSAAGTTSPPVTDPDMSAENHLSSRKVTVK